MRKGTTLNDLMQWDNTLFDGIVLNAEIDKDVLVGTIMLQCGLQECVYQDYDVFKSQAHIWFAAHEWNFDRLVRLIKEQYNPLWNKDGIETRTIRETFDGTVNETGNTTLNKGGTIKNDGTTTGTEGGTTTNRADYNSTVNTVSSEDTTGNTTGESVHSVKGFNATDWQETDKDNSTETRSEDKDGTETTTKTGNDTETTTHGKTDTTVETHTETIDTTDTTAESRDRDEQNVKEVSDTFVAQGNIGVTTSQAMFLEETNLLGGFNLYQFIARKFDNDLMIGVYV